MHILIIEDNTTIADNMKQYLQFDGHTIDVVYDWAMWAEKWSKYIYDVIILDLMLPSLDGFEVCKQIRLKKQTPIIMTTAKWAIEDKGDWFNAGADDYLVKPFALEELSMRVNALHKRVVTPETYRLKGNIEIIPSNFSITKDGIDIKCTQREFHICEYLAKNQGNLVTRRKLITEVWGEDTGDQEWMLDVYIANIRKKIWKDTIETIKGVWYKIPLL
jgi:DNA-binding response OmpR family regulator